MNVRDLVKGEPRAEQIFKERGECMNRYCCIKTDERWAQETGRS